MIRMSKEADYGLVLMTPFLAGGETRTSLSARQLAGETRLSLPMVSKVLKILSREGLLSSQRGVGGGYSLSREPDRITVAQIVSAMEGPLAVTECLESNGDCVRESTCPVRTNWQRINYAIQDVLESITLRDMAEPFPNPLVGLGTSLENSGQKERPPVIGTPVGAA